GGPPRWGRWAAGLAAAPPLPAALAPGPFILRSGSPSEDGRHTSNAGRFLSLIVTRREDYPGALRRVAEVLPAGGVVFVQPVVAGREAGVALFDGYYYERTSRWSEGGEGVLNVDLTAGRARG